MGTRFLATHESNAHPVYKEMLLNAGETDAVTYNRRWHPGRALRSPVLETILQMERDGRPVAEVRALIGRGRARKAAHDGNLEEGMFFAGAGSAMIKDVITVQQLFERTLHEYRHALERARSHMVD